MKRILFSKIVTLLYTTTLLIACSKIEDLNLNNEFAKKQGASTQDDEEIFVSLHEATEVADLFFSKLTDNNVSTKSTLKAQRCSASIEILRERGNPLMYIINYQDGGFVIMGSTKNYYPVLAYSDKNCFKITSEMNGLSEWLEVTKEAIKASDALKDTIKFAMHNLWKSYKIGEISSSQGTQGTLVKSYSYNSGEVACWNRCDELQMQYGGEGWNFIPLSQSRCIFDDAGFNNVYENLCYSANFNNSPLNCSVIGYKNITKSRQVGPLLNTQWHQYTPFNDLCNGNPAGCGAIALAQVLQYYKYPQSFSWDGYTFNWGNIPVVPETGSKHAALVRLVGSIVNIHYATSGSWATPSNMESGIRFLGYNVTRTDHNYESVKTQLLTYKRPVIMGGNANNVPLPNPLNYIGDSHYWVCDGAREITMGQLQYFTEWQRNGNGVFTTGWHSMGSPGVLGGIGYLYFYMNWGWSNTNHNGWFVFNDVNSGNGNYKYARQDFYISKP